MQYPVHSFTHIHLCTYPHTPHEDPKLIADKHTSLHHDYLPIPTAPETPLEPCHVLCAGGTSLQSCMPSTPILTLQTKSLRTTVLLVASSTAGNRGKDCHAAVTKSSACYSLGMRPSPQNYPMIEFSQPEYRSNTGHTSYGTAHTGTHDTMPQKRRLQMAIPQGHRKGLLQPQLSHS